MATSSVVGDSLTLDFDTSLSDPLKEQTIVAAYAIRYYPSSPDHTSSQFKYQIDFILYDCCLNLVYSGNSPVDDLEAEIGLTETFSFDISEFTGEVS